MTVVALGTSAPELAVSVRASLAGQGDLAAGNVIGSNIFNVLCILGAAAVARPVPLTDAARHFDLPVMLAVCLACVPVFVRGRVIARWEGALFLAYYAAYTAYLILAAAQHEALPRFSRVVFWYVIPLTAVTVVGLAVRDWRAARPAGAHGQ